VIAEYRELRELDGSKSSDGTTNTPIHKQNPFLSRGSKATHLSANKAIKVHRHLSSIPNARAKGRGGISPRPS